MSKRGMTIDWASSNEEGTLPGAVLYRYETSRVGQAVNWKPSKKAKAKLLKKKKTNVS